MGEAGPQAAWAELLAGAPRPGIARWPSAVRAARHIDVAAVWRAHGDAGVAVSVLGRPGYPDALAEDPEAPAVLFSVGDLGALDGRPRVAVVGTRSATRYGLGVAAQLGADLAAAGVSVVSGLALGIDGAAHEGALAAWRAGRSDGAGAPSSTPHDPCAASTTRPAAHRTLGASAAPVAVVAGSVAVPYPRQHAGLWRRVAAAGAVVSEAPLDAADLAWRFPQRNRIMAAMAHVVVVVECHPSGGSMHTVQAAARRGVPVGAVPGSIRSPASAGTNALLADGCFVVRDASDVLVAVGLATAGSGQVLTLPGLEAALPAAASAPPDAAMAPAVPPPGAASEHAVAVLDALGWECCSVDVLLRRTGLGLDELSLALERLRTAGVVEGAGGAWERTASGARNLSGP